MNDVRHLCELTLDVEAPPLREAEQVLAIASRAARRDRVVAATVGLAGVTVVAGLVTPALLPDRPPVPAPAVAAPAPAASATSPAAVSVPSASAPASHDRRMYDLLVAALPAGYEGRTRYPFAEPSRPPIRIDSPPPATPVYIRANIEVVVSDGRGEGLLWAAVVDDGNPLPTGDLCALPDAGRDCRVIDVAGVPVRVNVEDDEVGGEVLIARRYLHGGFLTVIAQRTVPEYGIGTPQRQPSLKPGLGAAFLGVEQLAAVAANPAMLP